MALNIRKEHGNVKFKKLADQLKALGDPTRLKIIALLSERDFCVCELVPLFGISQPAISKHLSRLKYCNLVNETRKGYWVYYSLNHEELKNVRLSLEHLPDVSTDLQKLEQQDTLVSCGE